MVVPGGVDRTGTQRVIPALLALIERLAREHDVRVYALRQEERAASYDLLGASIQNIGVRPRGLRAFGAILRGHRRKPFDVLHGFWAMPGAIAGLAGRALNVPVVTHLIGGDLVGLDDIDYGLLRTRRGRAWLRLAVATASAVAVESGAMQQLARSRRIGARRLPLGVDLGRWPPAAPRPRSGRARLLQVANLNRVKDQVTLLRAARELVQRNADRASRIEDRESGSVDFRLDMVGHDTLNGAIQAEARALGLHEQVRFHGFVPHDECRAFYLEADLLVVSSRHEAAPVAALEAAVCGVPAVGTHVGFLADWAPTAAISVVPRDPVALADAISALILDDAQRLSLARAAQQHALREDADWTAAEVVRLYEQLQPGIGHAHKSKPQRAISV